MEKVDREEIRAAVMEATGLGEQEGFQTSEGFGEAATTESGFGSAAPVPSDVNVLSVSALPYLSWGHQLDFSCYPKLR